jgi:hypothetical protein
MRYPEARVAEVCQLGSIGALELLEKGRAGNVQALADWAVRSAYRKMIRGGASPDEAIGHMKNLVSVIDIKPEVTG